MRGLLPPVVETQELQVSFSFSLKHYSQSESSFCFMLKLITIPQERKFLQTLRQYTIPLQRYMAMMDLQASDLLQNLFTLSNDMNFDASMLVHLTLMLSQSSGAK